MVEIPGGDWGHQVYEFTNLYIDTVEENTRETFEFNPWDLDAYPDRVEDETEFFDYCKQLSDEIDELMEE